MTKREQSIKWWNNLPSNDPRRESKNNLAVVYYNRPWNTLTGREIEIIWRIRTDKVLVDFYD